MCGLFAGIGKLNSNRMIALGSMSEERGADSVGLAYPLNGKLTVAKIAERAAVGLNITLKKSVTEAAVSGMFIGHTRQATQGAVNARNAHPFLEDGIAFAHNGVIINDHDFGKYEVDSESLIHGIKARDFAKYDGAIALVWIEEGKLKAYRCGNPLYRGRMEGVTYLASDDIYLESIGCEHIKQLSEGFIYTFVNATELLTQKVNKNETFKGYAGYGTGSYIYQGTGWEDQYKGHGVGTAKLNPAQRQDQWWKEEEALDKQEEERERRMDEAKARINSDMSIIVREDFRTPSDIARARNALEVLDVCEVCGELGELVDGEICTVCVQWMADNGVNDTDLPAIQHLRSIKQS